MVDPIISSSASGRALSISRKLQCSADFLKPFALNDPFNPQNFIEGWICIRNGPNFGAVFIDKVNQILLPSPPMIFSLPCLQSISSSQIDSAKFLVNSTVNYELKDKNNYRFSEGGQAKRICTNGNEPRDSRSSSSPYAFYVANIWDGFTVLVFKYHDANNHEFISIRTPHDAFLEDTILDCKMDLVMRYFKLKVDSSSNSSLHTKKQLFELFPQLGDETVQSIAIEFVGCKVARFVKYDFKFSIKPLMINYYDESIIPWGIQKECLLEEFNLCAILNDEQFMLEGEIGPICWEPKLLSDFVIGFQAKALELNERHKQATGIHPQFHHETFALKGKVLSWLDTNLRSNRRSGCWFKLESTDFSKKHSHSLEMQDKKRILSAFIEMQIRGCLPTQENMKLQMKMNQREYRRCSRQIKKIIKIGNASRQDLDSKQQIMLMMVGIPGSGKSTLANRLVTKGTWFRVNQDELGSRLICEHLAQQALRNGQSVVVDRCNFDVDQRSKFIDLALECNVWNIHCIWLDINKGLCKRRLSTRENHPTIPKGSKGEKIIEIITKQFSAPTMQEGFSQIIKITSEEEANLSIQAFLK